MRVSILLPVLLLGVGCYAEVETQMPVEHAPPAPAPAQPVVEYADTDPVCIETFRPVLEPYGTWIDDAEWGLVWVPSAVIVGPGFQPYVTAGHWAYTDEGYYWVSDFEWGWATFHYGRWVSTARGWVWIPGARYAPAWVEWRYGGGYIGWGPMPPQWRWHHHHAVWYEPAPAPFVFVHSNHFFHPTPAFAIVRAPEAPHAFAATTRWVSAPPAYAGAKPFAGPEPSVAGIPHEHVIHAHVVAPPAAKPPAVPWATKPVAPPAKPQPVLPPTAPKTYVPPPKSITPAPAPAPKMTPAPTPKPLPPAVKPKPAPTKPKPVKPKAFS